MLRDNGYTKLPRHTWAFIALLGIVLASASLRHPGFTQGGFASHDVAGILYNAMLLHDGALPFVDSFELKPPGSFYLAAALAGPVGTDIARFQIWANVWALASLVTVARIAWSLWGSRSAIVAAALYALHDAHLDTMDANYVTWAQLPWLLAMLWTVEAGRCRSRGGRSLAFAVAGALAGCAMQCKQPAGVALFVVLAGVWWPPLCSRPPVRRCFEDAALVLVGVAGAHVPIAAHYASAGHFAAWWDGYVVNRWALQYATYGAAVHRATGLSEGVQALLHHLALPLTLAGFAAWTRRPPFLWAWLAAALLAAAIGLRFFKGYFLAVAPPLVLLAAVPWGLLGSDGPLRGVRRALVLLPLCVLVARQGVLLAAEAHNRAQPHDEGGRIIARHIDAHAPAGERIWVWGWHLWDVYPLTGRLAATRYYKSIGIITSANDASWRRGRSPLRFVDSPAATELLEELERNRPAYIVFGSTVPAAEFAAMQRFVRRHYVRDRRVRLGRVQFWRRRGLPDPTTRASHSSSDGSRPSPS